MFKIACFSFWCIAALSMFCDGNHSQPTFAYFDGQTDNGRKVQTESGDVNQESFEAGDKAPSKLQSLKILRDRRKVVFSKPTADFDITGEVHREMDIAADETTREEPKDLDGRDEAINKKKTRSRRSVVMQSCKKRCHRPQIVVHQAKLKTFCYCDVDCGFFKDCCHDFYDVCGNLTNNKTTRTAHKANGNVSQLSSKTSSRNSSNRLQNLINQENKNLWKCYGNIQMIGSCPTSWPKDDVYYYCRNLSNTNIVTMDNYRYLPVYSQDNKVYHNPFCAKCNGVAEKSLEMYSLAFECYITLVPQNYSDLEEKINFVFNHCGNGTVKWAPREGQPRRYCQTLTRKNDSVTQKIVREAKPISKVFNNNSPSRKPRCSSGQVYVHYLKKCRNAIQPLPKFHQFEEYQILFWLTPQEDFSCSDIANKSKLGKIEVANLFGKVSLHQLKATNVVLSPSPCNLGFTLQVVGNKTAKGIVDKILSQKTPFNITIKGRTFTVAKVAKRALSCTKLQKYESHEYQVLQDNSSVTIKKTGEVLKNMDYYFNSTTSAIYVCRNRQKSNCSGVFIMLSASEFTLLPNKSIYVNTSGQLYDWSEYIWKKDDVEICSANFSETNFQASSHDKVLTMITSVCMSLSIICLVFVLITYSLFSELRTPPGINLMNLSVSILLSQLLWLLGSGQEETPMACTVIAVILHYLFLVSFMWTTIIAFDTWRAFATKGRRPKADSRAEKMKHYLRYMTIGWLFSLIYIAVCVLLDQTGTFAFGYQTSSTCWIGNNLAILYFFAVPVGVVLIINSVFFTMTLRLINLQSLQAKAASNRNMKQNFCIYLRIASLMGFTWVFGFAIPFGPQYVEYPFALLNTLQGVYIAIAFGCNKRNRKLYKKLFLGTIQLLSCTNRDEKPSESQSKYCNTNLDTKL